MSLYSIKNPKEIQFLSFARNYYLLIFIPVALFISCTNVDKQCDYCNSFLKESKMFPIPLREAKLLNNGLVADSALFKYQKMHFLTEDEVRKFEDNLFCFLGYTEKELLKNLEGINMTPADQSRWNKVSEIKTMNVYFYVCRSKVRTKNTNSFEEFYPCFGGSHGPGIKDFFLDFKLLNGQHIYCGNYQDSIRLFECIESNEVKE